MVYGKNNENQLDSKVMTKFVFKTIGITLFTIVVAFFYVMCSLVVFSPSTAGKVFSVVGSEKTVLICAEREYRKNPTNYNLYNLLQQSITAGDNERVERYVYATINSKNYDKFEEEINTISRIGVGKNKIAYVYDVDSYLTQAYVKALYIQGKKDEARQEFHFRDLTRDDHPYSISLIAYVNCLYEDDSMTDEEKLSDFSEYYENANNTINGMTIKEHLEDRLTLIETTYEETEEGRIFNTYMQIKLNTCFYKINDILGNNILKQYYSEKVSLVTEKYNNLINS